MTDHAWPLNDGPRVDNRAVRRDIDDGRGREEADPYCLRAGEATTLLTGHPWRRLAILGDSVAQGIGDPVEGYSRLSYPDRLTAELTTTAPGLVCLNLGRRDLRAEQVHATQLAPALSFRPDLALVVCGANNALSPRYDAAAVDVELAAMVTSLRAVGADVITVSTFVLHEYPILPGWLAKGFIARMRTLAAHTRELARLLDTIHVDLEGHPAEGEPGLHSADGLHGNARTQAIAAAMTIRRLGLHLGNSIAAAPAPAAPDLAADAV